MFRLSLLLPPSSSAEPAPNLLVNAESAATEMVEPVGPALGAATVTAVRGTAAGFVDNCVVSTIIVFAIFPALLVFVFSMTDTFCCGGNSETVHAAACILGGVVCVEPPANACTGGTTSGST